MASLPTKLLHHRPEQTSGVWIRGFAAAGPLIGCLEQNVVRGITHRAAHRASVSWCGYTGLRLPDHERVRRGIICRHSERAGLYHRPRLADCEFLLCLRWVRPAYPVHFSLCVGPVHPQWEPEILAFAGCAGECRLPDENDPSVYRSRLPDRAAALEKPRKDLLTPWPWSGAAIFLVFLSPYLLWQIHNDRRYPANTGTIMGRSAYSPILSPQTTP